MANSIQSSYPPQRSNENYPPLKKNHHNHQPPLSNTPTFSFISPSQKEQIKFKATASITPKQKNNRSHIFEQMQKIIDEQQKENQTLKERIEFLERELQTKHLASCNNNNNNFEEQKQNSILNAILAFETLKYTLKECNVLPYKIQKAKSGLQQIQNQMVHSSNTNKTLIILERQKIEQELFIKGLFKKYHNKIEALELQKVKAVKTLNKFFLLPSVSNMFASFQPDIKTKENLQNFKERYNSLSEDFSTLEKNYQNMPRSIQNELKNNMLPLAKYYLNSIETPSKKKGIYPQYQDQVANERSW